MLTVKLLVGEQARTSQALYDLVLKAQFGTGRKGGQRPHLCQRCKNVLHHVLASVCRSIQEEAKRCLRLFKQAVACYQAGSGLPPVRCNFHRADTTRNASQHLFGWHYQQQPIYCLPRHNYLFWISPFSIRLYLKRSLLLHLVFH